MSGLWQCYVGICVGWGLMALTLILVALNRIERSMSRQESRDVARTMPTLDSILRELRVRR